jgi:hypothetical protein
MVDFDSECVKVSGSHGGEYEVESLPGYDTL